MHIYVYVGIYEYTFDAVQKGDIGRLPRWFTPLGIMGENWGGLKPLDAKRRDSKHQIWIAKMYTFLKNGSPKRNSVCC